jgi:hypothetical protein
MMEANQMEKKSVFKGKSQDADGGGLEDGKLMQDPGRGGAAKPQTSWALEIYKGDQAEEKMEPDEEDDVLETDLEEGGGQSSPPSS